MRTTFKSFIKEDSRSEIMDMMQAAEFVSTHCMQAFNSNPVFRGMESHQPYHLVDPTKFERRSLGSQHNFYTLIVSNSDKWKAYPKRNRSLICTGNLEGTSNYSNPYRVLCADNANWGICPMYDFWYSFDSNIDKYGFVDLDGLNKKLAAYFIFLHDISVIEKFPHDDFSASYKDMIDTFNAVDVALKQFTLTALHNLIEDYNKGIISAQKIVFMKMTELFHTSGSVLKSLDDLLDPSHNDFKHGKIYNAPIYGLEVWTDSECILVENRNYQEFEALVKRISN